MRKKWCRIRQLKCLLLRFVNMPLYPLPFSGFTSDCTTLLSLWDIKDFLDLEPLTSSPPDRNSIMSEAAVWCVCEELKVCVSELLYERLVGTLPASILLPGKKLWNVFERRPRDSSNHFYCLALLIPICQARRVVCFHTIRAWNRYNACCVLGYK